jgi:SAM-dependent methyltransferase
LIRNGAAPILPRQIERHPMTDPGKPFRAIEPFLKDMLMARMLAEALAMGVIDALPATREALARRFALTTRGLELMQALLERAGVLTTEGGRLVLTGGFREALAFRDLMEIKLRFADLVLPDVAGLLRPFLQDGGEFLANSAVFELFRYDRAKQNGAENLAATRRWVSLTTGLTRYESAGLLELFTFPPAANILDIGGNSGELARVICAANPGVHATVFDLPLVCQIGREHLKHAPEAARIRFVAGDARHDALPGGMDVAIFKSVLHDWPEAGARHLLDSAARALKPGGQIVIFERLPFDVSRHLAYHEISNLMFLHHLRTPDFYRARLAATGFDIAAQTQITLDMPFFLLVAKKVQ